MNLPDEFNEFLQSDSPKVCKNDSVVFAAVNRDLKFFPLFIAGKITLLHILAASFTLLICPQFGIGPFAGSFGLMEFFMRFGHTACAIFCGGIFLGVSALFLSFVLQPGEILYFKKNKLPIFTSLALGSLGIFLSINKSVLPENGFASFEFGFVWFVSAVCFGLIMMSLGTSVRRRGY